MEQWSKKVAGLSPEKQALLLQKLAAKQPPAVPGPSKLPTIVPAPDQRYEPFPLSDMQQAYWIGRNAGFELGNVATHFYQEFDSTDLDLVRLNQAWQQLIARHDMLRAIVLPDGRQQVLADVPPYTIGVVDLRTHASEAATDELAALRDQLSHQMFRTDQWPLFDIRASRITDQTTRLHISIDGLILDAWSYQVLLREWFELYESQSARLAPLELTFRDYILAEAALRDTAVYQEALRYWRDRLPALSPAPDLPLACDPQTLLTPRFRRLSASLDPQRWQRLHQQMLGLGLTPASVLLTAYAEVIGRWSKSQRFTINVPRFNRLPLHPQVNSILGEFASFSLLAIDNSVGESFAIRARRVQEQLWKDLEHGYVSGVQLLRELAQYHGQAAPISMPIVFTSAPQDVHGQHSALSISPSDQGQLAYNITQTSQVWLDHEFYEDGGTLVLNWDAVEQLFLPGMLDDMFGAYVGLLQSLADDPAVWQAQIRPLLPAAQREQRAAVNATETPIPEMVLQDLFAAQVTERPDQLAVIAGGETLTYAELHARAQQVGQTLHRLGAQPNTLVAVMMEKSIEQVIGVLGILYSGAAYLPIDLNLPAERVSYLLTHSETKLVLTQSWLDATREWPPQVQRLCVDADEFDVVEHAVGARQRPDDLAYMIYTSGSTGQPKGVMVAHRGVVNAVLDTNRRFAIGPDDRVLALTALHHDMSVYDVFGVLAAGGTLVMPEHLLLRDPAHWTKLLREEQITLWNSVPAMLEMLLEYTAGHSEMLPSTLRCCFVGGDWLSVTLPQRLAELVPTTKLVSVGGPTETTLWNIMYVVETPDPAWTSIPYGRPIANTRYAVLNEAGEDCPIWVPGELYCAGVGVAQGYWRDPVKTAASFISDPLTGERRYRTGDLGRYLPDGTIEFLGRQDQQIKIHGQRIELGEIEAALQQHPAVRAAVVTAVGQERSARRLVAHVVPQDQVDGMLLDPAERIEFKLRQRGVRPTQPDQRAVALTRPAMSAAQRAALLARRTHRTFHEAPLALEQLGAFLSLLAQTEQDDSPFPKYGYPSGGGLYPVQTYIYIKAGRVSDLAGGVYYYHPRDHQLVLISGDAQLDARIVAPHNRAIFEQAAFYLLLIGQLDAITPMYSDLSRDLCLLEAGYMSQLLMSSAADYAIGLCPIGNVEVEAVQPLLALDEQQVVLHSVLGGGLPLSSTVTSTSSPERALVQPSNGGSAEQLKTASAIQEELQQFLRGKLPEHMIPASITILNSLPLTANGKVDRKALAASLSAPSAGPAVHVAPRNELERTLTTIWQEVLHTQRVGVHDNFFDLGGNSLHVVQIHTKIREIFDRDVPITVLFKNPTISFLAQHLSQAQPEQPSFDQVQDRGQRQKQALQRQRRRPAGRNEPHE